MNIPVFSEVEYHKGCVVCGVEGEGGGYSATAIIHEGFFTASQLGGFWVGAEGQTSE